MTTLQRIQRYPGRNHTERTIAYLKATEPGFKSQPWSEQCRRAALELRAMTAAAIPDRSGLGLSTVAELLAVLQSDEVKNLIKKSTSELTSVEPEAQDRALIDAVGAITLAIENLHGLHMTGEQIQEGETPDNVAATSTLDLRKVRGANRVERAIHVLRAKQPGFKEQPWSQQVRLAGIALRTSQVVE
jgi:hypothetical protein